MKRHLKTLLVACLVVPVAIVFAACGPQTNTTVISDNGLLKSGTYKLTDIKINGKVVNVPTIDSVGPEAAYDFITSAIANGYYTEEAVKAESEKYFNEDGTIKTTEPAKPGTTVLAPTTNGETAQTLYCITEGCEIDTVGHYHKPVAPAVVEAPVAPTNVVTNPEKEHAVPAHDADHAAIYDGNTLVKPAGYIECETCEVLKVTGTNLTGTLVTLTGVVELEVEEGKSAFWGYVDGVQHEDYADIVVFDANGKAYVDCADCGPTYPGYVEDTEYEAPVGTVCSTEDGECGYADRAAHDAAYANYLAAVTAYSCEAAYALENWEENATPWDEDDACGTCQTCLYNAYLAAKEVYETTSTAAYDESVALYTKYFEYGFACFLYNQYQAAKNTDTVINALTNAQIFTTDSDRDSAEEFVDTLQSVQAAGTNIIVIGTKVVEGKEVGIVSVYNTDSTTYTHEYRYVVMGEYIVFLNNSNTQVFPFGTGIQVKIVDGKITYELTSDIADEEYTFECVLA